MKKTIAILILLLAIDFCSFAQDTLTGVVSRVAAPYFEQNVCDTRFALTTGDETYYVMVDNYWPNPYLEDLVIHYDTIPIGNEIEVVGTIMEMVNGNGGVFQTIDIQQLIDATYGFGTGFINWMNHFATVQCNIPPDYACYIAIDGELQETSPIVFNGMTLDNGIYTVIGIVETWPNYNLPILELTQVIPYAVETTAFGVVVASDGPCLTTPCGEKRYLSWSDDDGTHYLTNKDKLKDGDFYQAIWGDHVNSTLNGFGRVHYNILGDSFQTFEVISMETSGGRSIRGQIRAITNPSTGIPISLGIAICQDGYSYLVDNLEFYEYASSCIFDGDTIQMDTDVTAVFSTATMFLGGWLAPHFNIHIESVAINTTCVKDNNACDVCVYPNPSSGVLEIVSEQPIESIIVYDNLGNVLFNKTCNSRQTAHGNNVTLDMDNLSPGIYVLSVKGNAFLHRQTIIKTE